MRDYEFPGKLPQAWVIERALLSLNVIFLIKIKLYKPPT